MANEKNLIPNTERTPEQIKEMTRKGGIASGVARRRKKLVAEALAELLQEKVKTTDGNEMLKLDAITKKALTNCFNGSPTLDDIFLIQKILGEAKINLDTNISMPNFDVIER